MSRARPAPTWSCPGTAQGTPKATAYAAALIISPTASEHAQRRPGFVFNKTEFSPHAPRHARTPAPATLARRHAGTQACGHAGTPVRAANHWLTAQL